MTDLKEKDYIRKVRNGKEEIIISLSLKFLKENKLKVGDYLDLRTLKKSKKISQINSD